MNRTVEEIGCKMDALGLWDALLPHSFAVRPRGTVLPYFCIVLKGENRPVKVRFLMLEGWQTFHDFVNLRADRNFGFYSTPIELPHLEMVVTVEGHIELFRHDTGFLPLIADEAQRAFAAKILWEAFGVMLRIEADRSLPLSFAAEKSVFARIEGADGIWRDEPLEVPAMRPHVEKITLPKSALAAAKDLPFEPGEALELDFRILPNVMTKEPRPRCVYRLLAIDAKTGEAAIDSSTSIMPEGGIRGMWQTMPVQVLRGLTARGHVPGEIRLLSGRVFRLLRPLCIELPFKLSLHDALPLLQSKF